MAGKPGADVGFPLGEFRKDLHALLPVDDVGFGQAFLVPVNGDLGRG
jgi:hypothetical protein